MAQAGLERFVDAQNDVLPRVLDELRAGRKRSHWMWYVFPQIAGLGSSRIARHYALQSADEAIAYLRHPVLGSRLRECVTLVMRHAGTPAEAVFGTVDALKFRSCLTLFQSVADDPVDRALFGAALAAFYAGQPDGRTLQLIAP